MSFRTFSTSPPTPDFTTTVNVHEHKLPKRQRQKAPAIPLESLIPSTLAEMEKQDYDNKVKSNSENEKKIRRALENYGVPNFRKFLEERGLSLKRKLPRIFQLNIGLFCNQACIHCHVESSPKRTEQMSFEVAKKCMELLDSSPFITTLDLTGGAPELNSQFRYLVSEGRKRGKEVIDRCNLTALLEPDQQDLIDFLTENQVRIIASLPCYGPKNVNLQRGSGVFKKSIDALVALNERGYGTDPKLKLDLVYNPLGAFLPPHQKELEKKYKEELQQAFGIVFNELFTLTNMPIKRFADMLYARGELKDYMSLLVRNFNNATVDGVMCTDHISIKWDGFIYDCDFNQQLDLNILQGTNEKFIKSSQGKELNVFDLKSLSEIQQLEIRTDMHCYGCTAGMGSSCQGTTV